jgi:prevent-host-death family protein
LQSKSKEGAMRVIGIRELKEQTSQILRRVREEGVEYQVTYHGKVIARLIPVSTSQPDATEVDEIWTDLDRLAAEIGEHWPEGVSAEDAVKEVRRNL